MASLIPAFATIAFILVPAVSDKIGLRKLFVGGSRLLVSMASLAILSVPSIVLFPMFVRGALGARFVIRLLLPMAAVEMVSLGVVGGIIFLLGSAGSVFGPFTSGLVRDVTGEFAVPLLLIGGISAVATVFSLWLLETVGKTRNRKLTADILPFCRMRLFDTP